MSISVRFFVGAVIVLFIVAILWWGIVFKKFPHKRNALARWFLLMHGGMIIGMEIMCLPFIIALFRQEYWAECILLLPIVMLPMVVGFFGVILWGNTIWYGGFGNLDIGDIEDET